MSHGRRLLGCIFLLREPALGLQRVAEKRFLARQSASHNASEPRTEWWAADDAGVCGRRGHANGEETQTVTCTHDAGAGCTNGFGRLCTATAGTTTRKY